VKACGRGGYLVDATKALPADPTVLHVERLPIVGCSRLRCERCKLSVRSVTKRSLARSQLTDSERAALYDRADLASSALLRPGYLHFRLYVCRCNHWLETSERSCNDLEPDHPPSLYDDRESSPAEASDPHPTWRCTGHPPLTLPQDVDGVAVASRTELRELALRGLHELLPPHALSQDAQPGVWLARLHARLEPADASVIVSAALDALSDSAPRARAVALAFLRGAADDAARRQIFELFERQPALFVGAPDDVTAIAEDTTLEHTAWRLMAPLLAVPGEPRTFARASVLAGGASAALENGLARHDKIWWDAKEEAAREEEKAARERDAARKAAAAPARALDDPRLQLALDSLEFRETLADSNDALGRFLRAAGAFAHSWYEEIDFTDWNGALVGRGNGALIRAGIPPSPDLPYSELAPLLEMGNAAREIVARHPSTPKPAPAPPRL
jgi:hypothetical protein